MQIGIIGGTGRMGRGLALRFIKNHDICIGSRLLDRAIKTSNELTKIAQGFYRDNIKGIIKGELNYNAIKNSEIILVTIPYSTTTQMISESKMYFNSQQIVVSPVVPMKKIVNFFF
jgi:predicted dinucleotide-binding enzyme